MILSFLSSLKLCIAFFIKQAYIKILVCGDCLTVPNKTELNRFFIICYRNKDQNRCSTGKFNDRAKQSSYDFFIKSNFKWSSFNCFSSISPGEPSIGHSAPLFFGNAITSRISFSPINNATNLSTPIPTPP